MTVYHLDSSALTKAYAWELGTRWVQELVDREQIIVSALCLAEVASALGRRVRERRLPVESARRAYHLCITNVVRFEVVRVSEDLIRAAAGLILGDRIPLLRALDAIHLATAVQSSILLRQSGADSLVFVAADRRLREAASHAGLGVENPEDHA